MELGIRFADASNPFDSYVYPAGCFLKDFSPLFRIIRFNTVVDPSKTQIPQHFKAFGVCRIQEHGIKDFLLKARGKYLRCARTIELMLTSSII